MAPIYLSGKANNEVYTFKEILKQPDKDQFEIAMYKEVQSMFDNDIWTKVTRTSLLRQYDQELKSGKDIKRRQLLIIWAFKRKRHPDVGLRKYKEDYACMESKNNMVYIPGTLLLQLYHGCQLEPY